MQKKILLSIAVSGAATLPALADVSLLPAIAENQGWQSATVAKPSYNGTEVSCGADFQSVYQTLKLPQGTYTIRFSNLTNAKVSIPGATDITPKDDKTGKTYELKVNGETDVRITVSRVQATPFSFDGFQISLNFNIKEVADRLDTRITATGNSYKALNDMMESNALLVDEYYNLLGEKSMLEEEQAGIQEMIDAIKVTNNENVSLGNFGNLKSYGDYKLYNSPKDNVTLAIDELDAKIKDYNALVADLNQRYQNYLDNTADKTKYSTNCDNYTNRWTAVNAAIKAIQDEANAAEFPDEEAIKYFNSLADTATKLLAQITTFRSDIDKTYATQEDLLKPVSAKLKNDDSAINSALTKLEADASTAKDDVEAFQEFNGSVISKINEAQLNAVTTISSIAGPTVYPDGKEGLKDSFKTFKANELTTIDEIYTTAMAEVKKLNTIAGFAANEAVLVKTIDNAVADLNAAAKVSVKTAERQANLYNEKIKGYQELQKALAEENNPQNVPANLKDTFNKLASQATKDLKALYDYYLNNLQTGTLKPDGDTELLDNFNNALTNLKNFSSINEHPDIYVKNRYSSLIATIDNAETIKGFDEAPYELDVNSKFTETYAAIDESIAALEKAIKDSKDGKITPEIIAQAQEIETAIEGVQDNAEIIINSFETAMNSLKGFGTQVNDIEGWINNKIIIPAPNSSRDKVINAFKAKYFNGKVDDKKGTGQENIQTKYNNFISQYEAAAKVEGYDCVTDADKLSTDVSNYNPGVKCAKSEVELTKVLSEASFKNLQDTVVNTQANVNKYITELGNLDLGFAQFKKDFEKVFPEVQKKIDAQALELPKLQALTQPTDKVDAKYEEAWSKFDAANAEIFNEDFKKANAEFVRLQDNYDTYKKFNKTLDNLVSGRLTDVQLTAAESPTPGARTLYGTKVADINKKIEALRTEWRSVAQDQKAVAQKTAYDDKREAINDELDALEAQIIKNSEAYTQLYGAAQDARKNIDGYLELLSGKNQEAVASQTAALKELRDVRLYDLNQNILTATNEGKFGASTALVTEYTLDLEDITAEADELYKSATDGYGQSVINVNNDKYKAWQDSELKSAQNVYNEAVDIYASYEDLTNEGLVKELDAPNSDKIYAYNALIRSVNTSFGKKIKKLSDETKVITNAQIQVFTDSLTGYKTAIAADTTTLNRNMNVKSRAYYRTIQPDAKAAYDNIETLLNGQSIDTSSDKSVFKPIKDAYNNAVKSYTDNAAKADFTRKYMDAIANNLDYVTAQNTPEGIQDLAVQAWDLAYTNVSDSVAKWTDEIAGYEYADKTLKDAQKKIFDDKKKKLAPLNVKALGDATLIANYKTYADQLDAIYNAMDAAHAAIKASDETAVANRNLKIEYIGEDGNGGKVGEAQNKFNIINDYAKELLVSDDSRVVAIQTSITDLKDYVEQNLGDLENNKATLEYKMTVVNNNIKNGYVRVRTAANRLLGTMLADVKDSYNKAVAAGSLTTDEQKSYEEEIKALSDRIDAAKALSIGSDSQQMFYKSTVLELQSDLMNLNEELGGKQPEVAATNLDKVYTRTEEALNKATETLAKCESQVQEKYGKNYTDLEAELAAVKAAYGAEGNSVAYLVSYYTKQMDAIAAEISTVSDAVDLAQENQKPYNELNTELGKSENELKTLKSTVETMLGNEDDKTWLTTENIISTDSKGKVTILGTVSSEFGKIRKNLDKALADLQVPAQKATISGDIKTQDENLLTADIKVLNRLAVADTTLAVNSVSVALDSLGKAKDRLVPETYAELLSKLNEYNGTIKDLRVVIDGINKHQFADNSERWAAVSRLKNAIESLTQIAADAKQVESDSQTEQWVLGDVNLNPDGIVNIIDVQMVANWVGEDMTYSKLYEENPRQALAADINGNKVLNIADITGIINLANKQVLPALAANMMNAEGSLTLRLVSEENNVRRYAVCLNSNVPFIGGQLDIRTAPGARVSLAEAGERADGHEFQLFDNGDFSRLLVYSMENAAFRGDGVIGFVEIEGQGKLTVDNIIFSDENSTAHDLSETGVSAVDDIIDSFKNGVKSIYNAAGQKFNKLQKGINIIRHEDGTTSKEIKKN